MEQNEQRPAERRVECEVIVRLTSTAGRTRDLRPVLDPDRGVEEQAARVLDFVLERLGHGAPFSLEVHDPDTGSAGPLPSIAYEILIPDHIEGVRVVVRDVE